MADVLDRPRHGPASPTVSLLLVLLAGLGLAGSGALAALPPDLWLTAALSPDTADIRQIVFHDSVLPRIAVSLVAGAALALSGALLQQILRNPLAEPSTIGLSAGAYLALTAATVFAPGLLGHGRGPVAFAGALGAAFAVAALSWRHRFAPLPTILAGLVVGLYCAAVGNALALTDRDALQGLTLWNSGSLVQSDWQPVRYLAPRLALAVALSLLVARPLALLGLGDEAARAAGVPVRGVRLLGAGIAVALSAAAVAAVGVVGFIGTLAPNLARLAGARTVRAQLAWSPAFGAALLLCADQAALRLPFAHTIPAGAVTAVIGAPALFLLMRRLRHGPVAGDRPEAVPARDARLPVLLALGLLGLSLIVAISLGQGPEGWRWAVGHDLQALLPWRMPRALAALGAGALLAAAGALLQRMTGNVMASPEILGVGAGAMIGAIALMMASTDGAGRLAQFAAAAAGAGLALAAILALGRRSAFAGEAMLLSGIVLTTLLGAVAAVLTASGDPRMGALQVWMSGSTYRADWADAAFACGAAGLLLLLLPFWRRWLEILPLGDATARSLGVEVQRSRAILLVATATATAAATLIVGPLSFAGLIAPRIAGSLGLRQALPHAVGSAVIGGAIMLLADWLGRNLLFPREIPAGLLASVIGGPFFLAMLFRPR